MHIHAWARLTNCLEVTGSRQMNPGLGLGHASALHGLGPVVTAPHSYAAATAWRPAGLGAPGEGGAAWSQGSGTMRQARAQAARVPRQSRKLRGGRQVPAVQFHVEQATAAPTPSESSKLGFFYHRETLRILGNETRARKR